MKRRPLTQQAVRIALVAGLFVLIIVAVLYRPGDTLTAHAQDDGQITHQIISPTMEIWHIEQPNVKQHVTPYPEIKFQPGDQISIDAGGCVQTGGTGNTWKRYVDPSGPNADRLYHGLIWIPWIIGGPAATGVPPSPVRINAYIGSNQSVTVPNPLPPTIVGKELYLRLGYEDDDYSDNGYYSHDDGTQNQCKNVGNAFVEIRILHGAGGASTSAPPLPFDLIWTNEDDNGIMLNAQWGWQVTHPGALPDAQQCPDGPFSGQCTNWTDVITKDTADICTVEADEPFADNSPPLFGVSGHSNWAAATYVGRVKWETHSAPYADDDYNFKFFPEGGNGMVSGHDNVELEFDSDETVDHEVFNDIPYWHTLHDAVDQSTDTVINLTLFGEGRYAIVTGLINLDMCHGGSPELHPVWAMAIRVKDYDPSDEVWAMFIRRWGDEGFCSGDEHILTDLPNDTYTFRLPWRPGATSVTVGSGTNFLQRFLGASGPTVQAASGQGVLVSFGGVTAPPIPAGGSPYRAPLGPKDTGNIIAGELHLQWQGGQGPAPIPNIARRPDPVSSRFPARPIPEEPEKFVEKLVAKMSPVQRSQFPALPPRLPISSDAARPLQTVANPVTSIRSLPRHAAHVRKQPKYRSVPDSTIMQRNQRLLNALRMSVGNRATK